jgi:hypothetical protein
MPDNQSECAALSAAIVLVLILIMITLYDITKLRCESEGFANEEEKIKRADKVIETVGRAMKNNPNMSFDQGKSYLYDMNAVEYKDTKNMVNSGENLTSRNLAARW